MTDPNFEGAEHLRRERLFPETGQVVRGAFLDFFDRYGLELCGYPVTAESIEGSRPVQFFQRVALEQPEPGVVRPLPIGTELLVAREQLRRLRGEVFAPGPWGQSLVPQPPLAVDNLVGRLVTHPSSRYPERALADIRHLVIHRTGAPDEVGPETIADYHVHRQGWPGIGYHFVVGADGHIWQTNGLITTSYHAREFNASAVGIALTGRFDDSAPSATRLVAAARLCAWLIDALHLSPESVEGHRDLVHTACPGKAWDDTGGWGQELQALVRAQLGLPAEPPPAAGPMAEPAAGMNQPPSDSGLPADV